MLFQLKLQSKIGTPRPLPISKIRPDIKITLKKCANEPYGANFRALLANWDTLVPRLTLKNFLLGVQDTEIYSHIIKPISHDDKNIETSQDNKSNPIRFFW